MCMLCFALTEIAHRRTYIQLLWVHTSILTKGQKGDTSRSAKLPNWQSSLESKTCYIWPRILFAFLTIFKVNMVVRLRVDLSMALKSTLQIFTLRIQLCMVQIKPIGHTESYRQRNHTS